MTATGASRLVAARHGVAIAALWGAVGCAAPGGSAAVEIGTGQSAWQPVAAGQRLGIVAGPQGGFHFVVNARLREMEPGDPAIASAPDNPETQFAAFAAGDRQINIVLDPERTGYIESPSGDGWYEIPTPSRRLLMIDNDEIPGVYDQRVRIDLTVIDAAGRSATDSREVIAVPYGELTPDAGPGLRLHRPR